ncbi:MAG: putative toxin-antitoxin system toxin component, PIN family, partial [Rhodospirillaceae bacterium]|nr:putative toxin-antitoxin system toxin component, PIN family [Rhodospirillaceae bacterium]
FGSSAAVRLVLDTNVLVSGILWSGPPYDILRSVQTGPHVWVTSAELLTELRRVLSRQKFAALVAARSDARRRLIDSILQNAILVVPRPLPFPKSRDPADDAVLAVAVAGNADAVVSGDADLLDLNAFDGIPIVTPVRALALMAASRR